MSVAPDCISFGDGILPILLAAVAFGVAIGRLIRCNLDQMELEAYRRIARLTEEQIREWSRR
jgi:hypothetical protein